MPGHRAYTTLSVVLALTSVALFTTSAFGQSSATPPAVTGSASTPVPPASVVRTTDKRRSL